MVEVHCCLPLGNLDKVDAARLCASASALNRRPGVLISAQPGSASGAGSSSVLGAEAHLLPPTPLRFRFPTSAGRASSRATPSASAEGQTGKASTVPLPVCNYSTVHFSITMSSDTAPPPPPPTNGTDNVTPPPPPPEADGEKGFAPQQQQPSKGSPNDFLKSE